MSAIEGVYQELSNAQRKRRDDNEKAARRAMITEIAGSAAIGLYRNSMENRADDFFEKANVIRGKNVYNQAQKLDDEYAKHAESAISYQGGEEQYVYDKFVLPYATKIAQQEYDGWDTGYTNKSKDAILKDFANNFKGDIYNNYKDIQKSRKSVDLSNNFEDFIEKSNVFPSNMASDIYGRLFGKKSKADVLSSSGENVLKELSPEIYELSGKQLYQEAGFEATKDFMETKKSLLEEKFTVIDPSYQHPTRVEDGKTLAFKSLIKEQSALNPNVYRFKTRDGVVVPSDSLGTRFFVTKTRKETSINGDTKEVSYIEEIVEDDKGRKTQVGGGPAPDANKKLGNTYYPNTNLGTVVAAAGKHIEAQAQVEVEDGVTLEERLVEFSEELDEDVGVFSANYGRALAAEVFKMENIFFMNEGEAVNPNNFVIANKIVLNRFNKQLLKESENDPSYGLHSGSGAGRDGRINGLEILEAIADSVQDGSVALDGALLRNLGRTLEGSDALTQAKILQEQKGVKAQAFKDLLNNENVRNLLNNKEYFTERLQGPPEKIEMAYKELNDFWYDLSGEARPAPPTKVGENIERLMDAGSSLNPSPRSRLNEEIADTRTKAERVMAPRPRSIYKDDIVDTRTEAEKLTDPIIDTGSEFLRQVDENLNENLSPLNSLLSPTNQEEKEEETVDSLLSPTNQEETVSTPKTIKSLINFGLQTTGSNLTPSVVTRISNIETNASDPVNVRTTKSSGHDAHGIMQIKTATAVQPGSGFNIFDAADSFGIKYDSKLKAKAIDTIATNSSKGIFKPLKGSEGKEVIRLLKIPELNTLLGISYLDYLNDKFNGDEEKMVLAYNQGLGTIRKWDGNRSSLNKEGQNYIRKFEEAE
tara:strand:+ start:6403 stop:9024 length:2622 start_codon:yes stop_codon:yes gene_type:complete